MGRRLLVQDESHYNFAEVNLSVEFGRALASVLLTIVFAFSTTGCAQTPPHLTLLPLSTSDSAFAATVEASASASIIGGNKVEILLNWDTIYPAMLADIRSATKTVTYAEYVFEKSHAGDALVKAFSERCRGGVQVLVLLDAHGSSLVPAEYIEAMTQSGCHVIDNFRPIRPWSFNHRNHRRLLVVDGRTGFTGGNVVGHKWRTTVVRVEGPAVQELQEAFAEHWREATGVLLGGEGYYPYPAVAATDSPIYCQFVRSSPVRSNFSIYTVFLRVISSARQSILITNLFLILDEQITAALTEASQRGVMVQAIVPGHVEYRLPHEAGRAGFGRLLKAGIELYEYQPNLLHAKTMVIDGIWSTIGSANLDNRSFAINDELNLVVYGEAIAHRMEKIFADDLRKSRKVTLEAWQNRGFVSRLLGMVTMPIRHQF